ncbi:MAG TPA: alpha/beta fold hydrolase [Lacipirellula sp.]
MLVRTEHWKFRPHLLLRNGHLQTLAAVYLPRKHAPYGAAVHYVGVDELPPELGGDQIVLHEDGAPGWRPTQPVVLMVHGLAGCHTSAYMCRMTDRLTARGYCVFRMDMRGCGAGEGLARKSTHCGRSGDVAAAVRYITELYPDAPIYAIGFSLGGCLALNMLAEAGDAPIGNLKRSMAVCPPVDLFAVERRFDSPAGRPYDKFFVVKLWRQIVDRWQRFPDTAPAVIPRQPRRLRQLDELVTAPSGGFESADDYYAKTQPGPKLHRISQPVLIIAAEDDPVVPTAPLFEYEHGVGVQTAVVSRGGHLGFIARANGDPDKRWLDWRIVEWIETGH